MGSSFCVPQPTDGNILQGNPILHRVHCSLNINTETGRLSARRPNLQNQPALEKDRYKVRYLLSSCAGRASVPKRWLTRACPVGASLCLSYCAILKSATVFSDALLEALFCALSV
jgi:hypothetical protein